MQAKTSKSKPRVIKDFVKLEEELQAKVLQFYALADVEDLMKKLQSYTEEAEDLQKKILSYSDPKTGQERFALPYETEDRFYMVRVDDFINKHVENTPDNDEYTKADDDLLKNIGTSEKPAELKDDEESDEEEKFDIAVEEYDEDAEDEDGDDEL